ncbi:MAG: hypothetical protein IJY28_02925 [Clostridia bacterium]|nr:hypothetical protein [Clostridia bacterium]
MMKQYLRRVAYALTRKRVDEAALPVREVRLARSALSFFHLSTNPILSFPHEGALWYFRACPEIRTAEAYWDGVRAEFFDSLDRLHISETHFSQELPIATTFDAGAVEAFRAYTARKWQEPDFRRMRMNADELALRRGFSIWADGQTYDEAFFEAFAMHDLPAGCRPIAVYFLWTIRSAAANYRTCGLVRGTRYAFFAASKAMASRIVAEELSMAERITPSEWCRLTTDDGNTWFGLRSASAPGHRMADVRMRPDPRVQKALLELNVLDVICHQPDHGPNNYNVYTDERGTVSVCAFDNDNAQTFFPWMTAEQSLSSCAPLVQNGRIHRPHLPASTAEALERTDTARLRRRLKPYLNALQIAAVMYRLNALRNAVRATTQADPLFLRADDQWNDATVAAELSGRYGRTYLSRLAEPADTPEG